MSNQRPLVITASLLGAVALLGAGVWFGRSSATPPPSAASKAGLSAEREAAYRGLIEEANARITRQNQLLVVAQRSSAANPAAPSAFSSRSAASIDPAAAVAAAHRLAPGARLTRPPELVSYHGQAAYEVVLDRGTVYVDASTSEVLHDGTTRPARPTGRDHDERDSPLALGGKRSRHHEEHEHAAEDDDD